MATFVRRAKPHRWLKRMFSSKSFDNQLLVPIAVLLILLLGPVLMNKARGQGEDLVALFVQAQSDPALRVPFINAFIEHEGLPEHVLRIAYSEELNGLALSNPLVQTENSNYHTTSHAAAIGRGYPSMMTFGPKMFYPAYRYADFKSVVQHEAAHAKFWSTGKLNHLDRVDTSKDSKARLRGLLPILFELDAIKTQTDHSSWQQTSAPFRKGQEAYRQKWLDKLYKLEQQSYMYDMKPLLDRILRTYK